ncbi:MAG: hypothetical protein AAF926_02130 [Pseudomonadota bacterium]
MTARFQAKRPVALINLSSSSAEDISGPMTRLFERYGYPGPEIIQGPSSEMGGA